MLIFGKSIEAPSPLDPLKMEDYFPFSVYTVDPSCKSAVHFHFVLCFALHSIPLL